MTLPPWQTYFGDTAQLRDGQLEVRHPQGLRERIPQLARLAALGSPEEKAWAQYSIRLAAQALNVVPASIFDLYRARGEGKVPPTFTVPALNLRALPFLAARQVFRVMQELDAAAVIFEISRSEMGYTRQRPGEYAAQILAAAVAEDYQGPVFLQGDHFQISARAFTHRPHQELQELQALIREALAAGFFQIDIDASTLVDLSQRTVWAQQHLNFTLTAQLAAFVREHQPPGVTVALGGEIGEVGGHNTTVEELRAFMQGFSQEFARYSPNQPGLSKISVQTGTAHGGVVLPDGSLAQVQVDFQRLQELSRVARAEFGLAGAVQHGASTLPLDLFDYFPRYEACEIHLATHFMNLLFDRLPRDLREEMYAYLREHHSHEARPDWSTAQFIYKLRKKALGPFKARLWELPPEVQEEIAQVWRETFRQLFTKLGVAGTRHTVEQFTPLPRVQPELRSYLQAEQGLAQTSAEDLAD